MGKSSIDIYDNHIDVNSVNLTDITLKLEGRRSNVAELDESKFTDQLESRCHGIASKLEGLSGTSIILPGNRIPYIYNEYQGLKSPETVTTPIISKPSENRLAVSGDGKKKNASSLRLDNRLRK